ncbi:MAG: hypothetical protein HY774_05305 [Acidobacteria bacterium]|nr:hypothetical protein [Acidobacteriota bacterium]
MPFYVRLIVFCVLLGLAFIILPIEYRYIRSYILMLGYPLKILTGHLFAVLGILAALGISAYWVFVGSGEKSKEAADSPKSISQGGNRINQATTTVPRRKTEHQ